MKMNIQFFGMQIRHLIGSALLVLLLAGVGLLGVVAARLVPVARVLPHTEQSVPILVREGEWPISMCSRLDNFMDAMMLNIASYDGREGCLESALKNYFWVTDSSEGVDALATRFSPGNAGEVGMRRAKYVRYWFGTIAIVRPVLAFLNYPQWRMVNTVLVFVTLAALLGLMYAAGLMRYGVPFLVVFALMDPLAIGGSFQFSSCFYLSMLPAIWLLAVRKTRFANDPAWLALTFAAIGALTSYFDLLTYPILTFALPMAFYALSHEEESASSRFEKVVVCLMHWGLGFFFMWLLKWILVTACTDVNAFYEVFHKIAERAGSDASDGEHISRLHAVRVNVMDFLPYMNACLVGGAVLAAVSLFRGGVPLFLKWVPVFCVAALPPVWMFLTANHAYIHHFFVCKSLAATFFVFLCWVVDAITSNPSSRSTDRS